MAFNLSLDKIGIVALLLSPFVLAFSMNKYVTRHTVSIFYWIIVSQRFNKNFPPHFDVEYQAQNAKIAIENGEILNGSMTTYFGQLVEEWREMHIAELMQNWERVKSRKWPRKIKPLE